MNFSINDLVTYFGRLVGRVVHVKADGWAVVEQGMRWDEYPAALLYRAR